MDCFRHCAGGWITCVHRSCRITPQCRKGPSASMRAFISMHDLTEDEIVKVAFVRSVDNGENVLLKNLTSDHSANT